MNIIQSVIDVVGEYHPNVTRTIVLGADGPAGVRWRLDNGHELSVFAGLDRVEYGHYDADDNLLTDCEWIIGELLPGDRVRTPNAIVHSAARFVRREITQRSIMARHGR